MVEEITLEGIGKAVKELRLEVEKKGSDVEKIERINNFLDSAEEKNQKLVQAELQLKNQATELKELADKFEAGEVSHKEMKTQLNEMEVAAARVGNTNADYTKTDEYKALNDFCKVGSNMNVELKGFLRTDVTADGGFLVPTELDNVIIKKITEIDGIRGAARVRTVSGKTLEMPIRNSIPVAVYEGEAEAGTDSQSVYGQETVTPFRQTFTTAITWDLLQDSAFNMESEILDDGAEAFAFGEGVGFVTGDGVKQPEGFVTNSVIVAGARSSGAAAVLTPESVILVTGDLKVGYDPIYVLNRRTLAQIRTFRGDAAQAGDEAGQFLWQPGLNGSTSNTLNGFNYVVSNSMPDVGADTFPVAFGDFRRGYTIIDRTGVSVIRDDFSLKKSAMVEFTINRWNTGKVVLPEAITLIKVEV